MSGTSIMARAWTGGRAAALAALAAVALSFGPGLRAADPPAPLPRVTALVPLAVPQGFSGTVRLRGVGLKEVTTVRVEGPVQPSSLSIKEKKDAATPTGIEASVAGDSEVVVELVLPAEAPASVLSMVVAVGEREAVPVALRVVAPAALVAGDPGTGFQNAKPIDAGQFVPGLIGNGREVDVYAVAAVSGRRFRIAVTARAAASLLDPLLTVYDGSGRQLAVHDDISVDNRDAALEITPAADGPLYCVVQDAHDTGSEWHAYLLEVGVVP